ncbi:MAG: FecR family protein [Sphingobacterium sp.]
MREEILQKFLSNQCSYKECTTIVHYFQKYPEQLDKIELFENIPQSELRVTPEETKQQILRAILPPKKQIITARRLLVAAVVLLVASFPFAKIGTDDTFALDQYNLRISLTNNGVSAYWHQLPDSSRIKLEPKSKVVYYSNFTSARSVEQIYGQATYYVHPDKLHPFRVNKRGLQTQALGTIFTIADYDTNRLIITLNEGKIVVSNERSEQVFMKDQATLIINKDNFHYQLLNPAKTSFKKAWEAEKQNSKSNYPASTIAWSNKVVNFKGVTNTDLFGIMERLYSVTIDVANPTIINGNFTGKLNQDENIKNLLTIFCQINDCEFNIEEDIITIK